MLSFKKFLLEKAEENAKTLSPKQKAYRMYFASKLKEYGVSSPNELDDAKKKEFFNAVEDGWKEESGTPAKSAKPAKSSKSDKPDSSDE